MQTYFTRMFTLVILLNLPAFAGAQEKELPPIAVPPPQVGDPVAKEPARVDPGMVTKPGDTNPPAGDKNADDKYKIFCSEISNEDVMEQCKIYVNKQGGNCQELKGTKTCKFQARVIPIMNSLKKER